MTGGDRSSRTTACRSRGDVGCSGDDEGRPLEFFQVKGEALDIFGVPPAATAATLDREWDKVQARRQFGREES